MSHLTLSVNISIGKASGEGCPRFGICKVSIGVGFNARLSYDADLNLMDISISQESISNDQPDKLPYFQDQSSVTFEESYTFPEDVQLALKSDHPLTVPPQTCPLRTEDGNYVIQSIQLVS